jgi:coenzyme F420 hydrogenase subunit beta
VILVHIQTLAKEIGVHRNTIRNWLKSGKIAATPGPGKGLVFTPEGFARLCRDFQLAPQSLRPRELARQPSETAPAPSTPAPGPSPPTGGTMKTFFNLIQEVQKPGLCHHCGGCVTFCTAINYGALELGEDGRPRYKDVEKCIECGLCYSICPEIGELDEETKRRVFWSAPLGRILEATVARSQDPEVRARAADGGVVTGLLLHLFDLGRIDGAIVSRQVGPFQRQPWLALSREEILEAAGFHFDTSHGMTRFSDVYSTYSPSIVELEDVARRHLNRVALVGTPCQINSMRRMEVLGIVPSASIKFHLGLFCTGNFHFGPEQRQRLEEIGNFKWEEVRKVNVKEELMIHLHNREVRFIPLDQLEFMKRFACQYCDDYAAEFADLSFGGIGAPEGWTTVIARSPLGRAVLSHAKGFDLEVFNYRDNPAFAARALAKVLEWSEKKKRRAREKHRELEEAAPLEG